MSETDTHLGSSSLSSLQAQFIYHGDENNDLVRILRYRSTTYAEPRHKCPLLNLLNSEVLLRFLNCDSGPTDLTAVFLREV